MMCRFYKSAISLAIALLGTLGVLQGQVQVPPATPTGKQPAPALATPAPAPEKKPKVGYVRFWNMLPKGADSLFLLQKGAAQDAPPLATADPLNYYADYEQLPPAKYAFSVVTAKDKATTIQQFDVILRQDVYVTFLATLQNGVIKVEMLDDTYDPVATATGRLTIRNHFPDAKISVAGGGQNKSRMLGTGEVEVMDGFPTGPVLLQMQATVNGGKTQKWSTQVNFKNSKHASLLVVPDPYGRFRPRVSIDGPTIPEVVAPAP